MYGSYPAGYELYILCLLQNYIKIGEMILNLVMQVRKAFEERLFTNFLLSDRVPADNFYRRLKDTLDLRFIYKATAKYCGTEGQESIDPTVFFKLILVGYLENLGSDRRIINTASMRLDILYLVRVR